MIILFDLYHTGHLQQGHHSCPPAVARLAKLLMSLVITAHTKRYTGVRSGMSSGDISQKQELWGRQVSELPSMDDDQQLCGTEGQVQELSHEELTPLLDEEISDHLTENQYANILEVLRKVQLLLEETTASYARELVETGPGIQGLYVMSNSVEFPANKTYEQLEEMQPKEGQHEQLEVQPEQLAEGQHEQLEEMQPEQLAEGQHEQLEEMQPKEGQHEQLEVQPQQLAEGQHEQLEEMQPEQLAEGQHEQLEEMQPKEGQHEQLEVQPEQLAEGQHEQLEEMQPEQLAEGQHEHEQLEERQPEQLAEGQHEQLEERQPKPLKEQLAEVQPEHREQLEGRQPEQLAESEPMMDREPKLLERPMKRSRPLEEKRSIEDGFNVRLTNGNWLEQKMEMAIDPSEHKAIKEDMELMVALEQQAKEGVWAPMLELELLLPERNQNYRQIEGPVQKQVNSSWIPQGQSKLMVNLRSVKVWGVVLSTIAHNGSNIGVT